MAAAPKKMSIVHRLYTGEISYDFIKNKRIWYSFTAVLLLICVCAVVFKGVNWGIEFKGGSEFTVPVTEVTSSSADEATDVATSLGLPEMADTQSTTVGTGTVRVQTRTLETAEVTKVKEALAKWAGVDNEEVGYALVGASWGAQITQAGVTALIVFLVLVMILIWIYFRDIKMSVAAIVALMHDLFITIGVYALVGFTITPATLIGMLTILGYSLYDTVVVFDKIKENIEDIFDGDQTYSQLANKSVNQVLVRSLNTTIIGVLPVAALTFGGAFILGTGPLKDLGLALLVGMIAGTYSSIFLATPMLTQMRELETPMKEHRARLERRAQRKAKHEAALAYQVKKAERVGTVLPSGSTLVVEPDSDLADLSVVSAEELDAAVRRQPSRTSRSQRKK
ncbi:MAG: protein translocase subunit SecF [Propionibacteriaceae bacterium]|jgi:preprotein translocase subunit SecF|nr:protein translocase subunit SecF [Propionibacteriaceae bacterium]